MRRIVIGLSSIVCLTGCSQSGSGNVDSHAMVPRGNGVLGALRPKVDPKVLAKIEQQEAEARAAAQASQQAAAPGSNNQNQSSSMFGSGRVLPKVITDPIAPPAEEVAKESGPIVTPINAGSPDPVPTADASAANAATVPNAPTTPTATYGAAYNAAPPPPPGALGGGLIPPPPAVTLSTQAQAVAYGNPTAPPNPYGNPYANPYANPYMNPYAMPYQPMAPAAPAGPAPRPAGSPFSAGNAGGSSSRASSDDDDAKPKKSAASFVPITPTGMESRSPYKQRDDLKILWKGFLATSPDLKTIAKDDKIAEQLAKVDVGLPSDATKGSFEVSQSKVDSIFKQAALDKRVAPQVKKLEKDLVQSYMRYLYSYNKYALAQQSVAARKQEVDYASTPSESQRAATDLAQAQTDAESTKDDMKAAQGELVSTVGANAARTIIGHVSGVTPTLESLAQAPEPSSDDNAKAKGGLDVIGSVGSIFGFHHKKEGDADKSDSSDDGKDKEKVARGDKSSKQERKDEKKAEKAEKVAEKKADKTQDSKQESKKDNKKEAKADPKKDKKAAPATKVADKKDLAPAPDLVASKGDGGAAPSRSDISFVLKEVNVTPRKSVLTVTIHNAGSSNFSFGPDSVSISDGSHKLADAAVRADFDQTLVPPNQDVKGTITIFGRPYNDRLAVVLSDGGKSVQMRRQ
jgi:hypothetical protein